MGPSLVVLWLRGHLLTQGTQVCSLVRGDSTYCRATKPVHHHCGAGALEGELKQEEPLQWARHCNCKATPRWPQLEKAHAQRQSEQK